MEFVLVSDPVAANFVRRELANSKVFNVKVGNYNALLEVLKELWILDEPLDEFDEELRRKAVMLTDAFWSKSIRVDEESVIRTLSETISLVLNGLPLAQTVNPIMNIDDRTQRYFNDIVRLINSLSSKPRSYQISLDWFSIPLNESLANLILHTHQNVHLYPWQKDVVHRLTDGGQVPSQEIQDAFLKMSEIGGPQFNEVANSLFVQDCTVTKPEQFYAISCRDQQEEAEVLANRIASLISTGTDASQIAIIYPKEMKHLHFLVMALQKRGVCISNFPMGEEVYDWQSQLLRDLISLQDDNAPPMALKSVISNPLMPWSSSNKLERILNLDSASKEIADEIAPGLYDSLTKSFQDLSLLKSWLNDVGSFLSNNNQSGMTNARWERLVDSILELNQEPFEHSFDELRAKLLNKIQAKSLTLSDEKGFYLDAVLAVNSEEDLPFPVDHLFWMHMNDGHYQLSQNALIKGTVFDLQQYHDLGLGAHLGAELDKRKSILKRSISRAKKSITATACEFDLDGSVIQLGDITLDLTLCFYEPKEANPKALFDGISDLEDSFFTWETIPIIASENRLNADLNFSRNLLHLNVDKDGNPRPESPSSLEKLVISPLYWLLERQGIVDRSWKVQKLDPNLEGKVAHKVFELFEEYQSNRDIESYYEELFFNAIEIEAPFLKGPEWRLDRINLSRDIKKALDVFSKWLAETKWSIDQAELMLHGELWGIPVKGFSDAVLAKDNKVLILDYKRSKSDERFRRLSKGYDLQTFIYRKLYSQMFGNCVIQSGYYILKDQTFVLDISEAANGIAKLLSPDCSLDEQSINARRCVEQSLSELSNGLVKLNSHDDLELWKKRGVNPIAIEENSLIQRFLREGDSK
ncbi:PD-(D/E)XK nuclease family protein [Alteromonas facilis]|uniref:PD-(D/E)XK nuclease family protein n=1 Tax=Alteromonas facilis TaxID=2048004 RepID=UPI000C28C7D3|nr:PD-(D/E)XK nuclease family protein [Alteromonas facilis]